MNRLLAIGFIWIGCTLAWMVLGSTIVYRGGATSRTLVNEVHQLWGEPMDQLPPIAQAPLGEAEPEPPAPPGTTAANPPQPAPVLTLPLVGSDIDVAMALEQRQKGLMWFPTYEVDFAAAYTFANPTDEGHDVLLSFPLPGANRVYDGFRVVDDAGEVVPVEIAEGRARWKSHFHPQDQQRFTISYHARGTESWRYQVSGGGGPAAKVDHFRLAVRTDFAEVDFPAGTLSPSSHGQEGGGWRGEWKFDSLVSGAPIGLELPQLLNPGPLASQITFFAPVSLLFFFFVVAILSAAHGKNIHPLNYFLLGCAFFAFHLLFAYLVDHLPIVPSFAASAAVSLALCASYARLFVGWRFALVEIGLAQLVYLVLFSFTFFWKGFTGLSITVGAIVTLFVIMQITGRRDWAQLIAPRPAPSPEPQP